MKTYVLCVNITIFRMVYHYAEKYEALKAAKEILKNTSLRTYNGGGSIVVYEANDTELKHETYSKVVWKKYF